jgi:hypothetical protein
VSSTPSPSREYCFETCSVMNCAFWVVEIVRVTLQLFQWYEKIIINILRSTRLGDYLT